MSAYGICFLQRNVHFVNPSDTYTCITFANGTAALTLVIKQSILMFTEYIVNIISQYAI